MKHSSSDSAIQALKVVPFFSPLSEVEANDLAQELLPRQFSAKQTIFHLGDPGGLIYIITKGKVKITHVNVDGQEAVLAILGPGDFFGELALLDDSPRSATAKAIEATSTLTLHRDRFLHFLEENPTFSRHVLRILAKRIRHLNNQISDIFFLDLSGRLARTLLNLAKDHGREKKDGQGILIDLVLTQTDMAEMIGATRVSINKVLSRFRKEKWVQVRNRRVTILDAAALERVVEVSGGL